MLTLKFITENKEKVLAGLAKKQFDGKELVEQILELDARRKNTQKELDASLAEMNRLSRSIGQLMQQGKKEEAQSAKERTTQLKEQNKTLDASMKETEDKLMEVLVLLPNMPHESVPEGKNAADNVVERSGGIIPELP
ncbi:MAG: serine--tRNA ligase, partial [Bacteroidota bacterium]|nr:serine--tRNA ligase [Bacteroidota bacterium]